MTKFKRMTLMASAALLAIPFLGSTTASATAVTSAIVVSAQALSTCLIIAGPMAFGNYAQTVTNATAALVVTCTALTPFTIALDKGTTTGGTTSARLLFNVLSNTTLAYSLFTDSGRTLPWTTNTVAGNGTGLPQTVNVYGSIAANLLSAPGAYLDSVTATLTY